MIAWKKGTVTGWKLKISPMNLSNRNIDARYVSRCLSFCGYFVLNLSGIINVRCAALFHFAWSIRAAPGVWLFMLLGKPLFRSHKAMFSPGTYGLRQMELWWWVIFSLRHLFSEAMWMLPRSLQQHIRFRYIIAVAGWHTQEHCTQISFGSRISHVLMMIHKSLIFDQINMRIVKFMRFMVVIRVRRMSKGNEGFNIELLELRYRVLW